MRAKRIKTERKGFIVVVVLCMIICMAVLLLGFNYQSRSNLRVVDNFQKSTNALNCARAGLNIAIAVIKDARETNPKKISPNPLSEDNTFVVGQGNCSVSITEENAKLNINLLIDKNSKPERARIDQLLRLIDLLNRDRSGQSHIGYGLVPAIIDWIDSDDQVTHLPFIKYENSGAESAYYGNLENPYRCANAPIEAVEELLLVKGITQDVFESMREHITVYGSGEININRASKRVIESLSEKMDSALAQMIVERRKFKPFDSIMELRDVPGMTDGIYNTIRNMVTVSTADEYYHVETRGNAGHRNCTIEAILRKNTKTGSIEVVFYKES